MEEILMKMNFVIFNKPQPVGPSKPRSGPSTNFCIWIESLGSFKGFLQFKKEIQEFFAFQKVQDNFASYKVQELFPFQKVQEIFANYPNYNVQELFENGPWNSWL